MKHSLFFTVACFAIFAAAGDAPGADAPKQASAKKGIGLPERRGKGLAELEKLNVAWYYNWGSYTEIQTDTAFVPMIYSGRRLEEKIKGDVVLGFNEPDHPKQANMTVEQGIAAWPRVAAKAKRVGAPAMAGNPLTKEWLAEFMKAKPRVDFINVHWYKGVDSRNFIRDMEQIHKKFKLPIWVTEFAPQTTASSEKEPGKYSQQQVDKFIRETTDWMERTPWVERYAWHDSGKGTSALYTESGSLTATGKTYAAITAAQPKAPKQPALAHP